jgi:hypothetical protein
MILMMHQPDTVQRPETCNCGKGLGHIYMQGYAVNQADMFLCSDRASQLSRKLLEDLCELVTGGRNR